MRNGIFLKQRSDSARSGPLSADSADCLAIAWCSVPWVPQVFSRVRRGASFRRPQADTCSAEGRRHERFARVTFEDLTETGNPEWKAFGTQGRCSVKRQIRLSYQNITETLRGCVLNSPYPSNPSDLEICWVYDELFCYPQVTWHTSDPCLVVLPDRK